MEVRGVRVDVVEETIVLGGRELEILRPRDRDALLDEQAFEHEEFLPYWAELWPSGAALARAVERRSLGGRRIAELGCGLALPSIVAALGGARVLATDWSPDALRFATLNAERNAAALETMLVTWAEPEPLVARGPFDVVLGSDLLYERRNGELLLELLSRLVHGRSEILIADPGRPHTSAFLEAVAQAFTVTSRPDPARPSVAIHALRKR